MDCERMDALKGAMLLEMRGRVLYEKAAQAASDPAVRDLFQSLAEEEGRHQEWLEKMFVAQSTEGATSGYAVPDAARTHAVLSPEVIGSIRAAGFESAVISAAIGLEEKAIDFYDRAAADSSDRECSRVFTVLADWERTHLELLVGLDRQIRDQAWFDGGFWPSI